jgi:hypothetical protein
MKAELLRYAFTGVNIIPTTMLIMIQLYWLVAILGLFDFEVFDIEFDVETGDAVGPLGALAVFINLGQVPVALALSLLVLNFWIIAMLTYYLPINIEGLIAGLLLIPEFFLSLYITKLEVQPLKKIFKKDHSNKDIEERVLKRRCTMITDMGKNRLGQARIKQRGASIVINVRAEFEEEVFENGEIAFVFRHGSDGVFYITKSLSKKEFELKEMEEN